MFFSYSSVCGLIIVVGTGILGRLFISRKWRVQQGEEPVRRPEACFHTCSSKYMNCKLKLHKNIFGSRTIDIATLYNIIECNFCKTVV